jgi:hypothetical protein
MGGNHTRGVTWISRKNNSLWSKLISKIKQNIWHHESQFAGHEELVTAEHEREFIVSVLTLFKT